MATIVKRGPYQYAAQVRRKGFPAVQKTFTSRRDAEMWAAETEAAMRRNIYVDRTEAERTTFAEALDRYRREVTPGKRGQRDELTRIRMLLKHPLAARSLASLRSADFAAYRDERLQSCGPATVRREFALISHVFSVARKDWSLPLDNPILNLRKPPPPRPRDRRLAGDEEARLLAAARASHAEALELCIVLALETGMRAGEIKELTWKQIDFAQHVIVLDETKNGDKRIVPLSLRAESALRTRPRPITGGRLTRFYDRHGLSTAFRRACQRAGIEGLHFHDLRHEAASRLAPHMPVQVLAKVFGWRTLQMAMRYYNPTAADLVAAVRAAA